MASRTALVIAHPGHELRVHHWVERERPLVFVLTDGSGHTEASRLDHTSRILRASGARPGSIFGRYADRDLYGALLDGDVNLFVNLAVELAAAFRSAGIDTVACDAAEGYNPSHDVCRYLTASAAFAASAPSASASASASAASTMRAFDFPLIGAPDTRPAPAAEGCIRLRLNDAALDRKVAAASAYSAIARDVDTALTDFGREAFRVECLRPLGPEPDAQNNNGHAVPYYESYGERQVAAGHYSRVLRYRDHVRPVQLALARQLLTAS